jgi:imidazole glycerol-phosphate synthase subunit HisF
MFKQRIIACLIVKNGIVVQSINFERYLPVGHPSIAVEFLNNWGIDEIVLLEIDDVAKRRPPIELVREVSEKCFVPLCAGGGIKSLEDIHQLIKNGADKISINSSALLKPELISEASEVFGEQCIVVSIDAKRNLSGQYEVYSSSGSISTGYSPDDWARKVEQLGAGEILINSIERDGTKMGYDLKLIRMVSEAVSIPVIACGGVGQAKHLEEGLLEGKATAVAAANFFHFTEHSVNISKAYLKNNDLEIRGNRYAGYKDFAFEDDQRIAKRSDSHLDGLRFKYFFKEVI